MVSDEFRTMLWRRVEVSGLGVKKDKTPMKKIRTRQFRGATSVIAQTINTERKSGDAGSKHHNAETLASDAGGGGGHPAP